MIEKILVVVLFVLVFHYVACPPTAHRSDK